jgi:hypothetical protein
MLGVRRDEKEAMGKKFGFSFSWKRASGLSALKGKLSRKTGVPLTRGGRQRKFGKMAGCCVPLLVIGGISFLACSKIVQLISLN